jgi:hypothetical protein
MRTLITIALVVCVEAVAYGQGKTDVVILANGDRITGEISRLERGRLKFETDDAGTLYLEWDKLVSVVAAKRIVEVLTTTGARFLGPLVPATDRAISVATSEGAITLQMAEVTLMTPIGTSFWRKLDGSIDVGFSSTQSSGVTQLNVNSETVYRKPAFSARLSASATLTETEGDEGGRDDRGYVQASYLRYPWQRWFFTSATRFETNESLGLELRSQIWAAAGPRLVNSNRAQMVVGGGLAFNDERGVDVEPTQNIEGLGLFQWSFYTYDRPKTNLDVSFQYYPSLSNWGRQRLQLDAGVKRELWSDFFVSASLYNTFDSRPPNPDANTNDVGVVVSIGWSY